MTVEVRKGVKKTKRQMQRPTNRDKEHFQASEGASFESFSQDKNCVLPIIFFAIVQKCFMTDK